MEKVRQYFETIFSVKLSEEDWQLFSSKIVLEEFSRKHTFLKVGQMENYLSFIDSGIVRYFIPKIENDITFAFVFANNFASAYDSFITQTPAQYQAETLTKTKLWRISYDDLQTIYSSTEIGNVIGRYASENMFLRKIKRELSLLNESPEQRYLNLFTEQPQLIKEIPLKYIASYIGVTPQALSRIRKRIS